MNVAKIHLAWQVQCLARDLIGMHAALDRAISENQRVKGDVVHRKDEEIAVIRHHRQNIVRI